MTIRPVRIAGDAVLHNPTRTVTDFGRELRALVTDMFETMYVAEGVGLAANQIGVDLRVFVYDCPDGDDVWHSGVVVNPRLAAPAVDVVAATSPEGCLSVPGQHHPTPRAATAKVVGTDLDGEPVEIEATGMLARCLQHEVGHLDGHLYLEHLPETDARAALQELRDTGRTGEWLPALPDGFSGPVTRNIELPSGAKRGPLVVLGS